MDFPTKAGFVAPDHPDLALHLQTRLLGISRSHFYHQPSPVSSDDIRIMNLVDKVFTDCPFYGSRKIVQELKLTHHEPVNRKRVQRLMREMGLEAIYPKPKKGLSSPLQEHKKYPYLLKNLSIIRPNQVWGADVTYIRLSGGFCYLVAIIDWRSRFVVDWTLAESLEMEFCIKNLQRALQLNQPEIHNSDQGSQFTSPQYTDLLANAGVQISMDGRGRCMDNIFTERLWRTVKYENVYLHDYLNVHEARQGLTEYFKFYNYRRRHQSLDYQTPAQLYLQT